MTRLVLVESPYAGDVEANLEFARRCVRDCLLRGESPIASHLLYTQPGILDDNVPEERARGIEAGLAWLHVADASMVYYDRGISKGMRLGIERAHVLNKPVYLRCCYQPKAYDGRLVRWHVPLYDVETRRMTFEVIEHLDDPMPYLLSVNSQHVENL